MYFDVGGAYSFADKEADRRFLSDTWAIVWKDVYKHERPGISLA